MIAKTSYCIIENQIFYSTAVPLEDFQFYPKKLKIVLAPRATLMRTVVAICLGSNIEDYNNEIQVSSLKNGTKSLAKFTSEKSSLL